MARFFRVQIETIYLTSDGLVSGIPAKLQIPNADDILTSMTGAAFPTIGGGAVLQLVPWTSGKQFEIQIETYLYEAVWTDLIGLINDAMENDTALTVIATGDTGDFTTEAKPFPVKPFSSAGFENTRIYKPNFKFITV